MDYDSDTLTEWSENDASEFMYENFFAELMLFAEEEDELEFDSSDSETDWDSEEEDEVSDIEE